MQLSFSRLAELRIEHNLCHNCDGDGDGKWEWEVIVNGTGLWMGGDISKFWFAYAGLCRHHQEKLVSGLLQSTAMSEFKLGMDLCIDSEYGEIQIKVLL